MPRETRWEEMAALQGELLVTGSPPRAAGADEPRDAGLMSQTESVGKNMVASEAEPAGDTPHSAIGLGGEPDWKGPLVSLGTRQECV